MSDQEMEEQIYEEMAEFMAAPSEEPDWKSIGMALEAMQSLLEPIRAEASHLTTADLMNDPSAMRGWAILQNVLAALEHVRAAVELIQEEENSK